MDIDPLTRLAVKHGTDKWGPHFYAPVYHSLFSHLRDRPIRLLEIGVGGYGAKTVGGASLAMWAEYFPQGQISGLDISEKRLSLGPRITLLQGSQDDVAFLARVAGEHGPFDIIIDDGSHVPAHVVTSFETLFAHLVEGGLYVIEDVQTTYWPQYGGSAKSGGGIMALARSILDGLNHAEIKVSDPAWKTPAFASQIRSLRAYHNMLAIEKGDNDEPSNAAYRIDNPSAAHALKIIEREMERAPTAHGIANLVDMYSLGGRHPKAHAVADDALGRWPEHPALLYAALAAADRAKEPARSLRYAEGLLRVEPDNAGLQQRVSALRRDLPPPSQSTRQAPAAATGTADQLTAASDLHRQGRLAEAAPLYAAVLAAEPDNFDALNRLGILNLQRGDHDEAHRLLTAAVARNPRSHAALSNLATVLLAMQRFPDALEKCDQALALQPDEPSAHYNRGHVLLQLGRAAEAVESYDRALSLRPDDAQATTARGRALLMLDRLDDALAAFDRSTAITPNDADAWFNHASALALLGRHEDAVTGCRRALALRPDHLAALGKLASCLQTLGRPEEALAEHDRLLAARPNDPGALNNRALVLLALDRPLQALTDFDKALAMKPDDADVWYNSANAAVAAMRAEDAIVRYDRTLAMNPGHLPALNNRGNALRSLGRLEAALASYDRAAAIEPGMIDVLYNRANVLAALRRHGEAMTAYGRVLEIEPRHFPSRWARVMATLPGVALSAEELQTSRREFAGGLDELERHLPDALGARQAMSQAVPFYLAYQEENNRDLFARYGALCARAAAADRRPASRRGGGPLRLGIVSAHVRRHSVWDAILKGLMANVDPSRIEIDVFHVGALTDAETRWAAARAAHLDQGPHEPDAWADRILARQPDVLLYPEVGMDLTIVHLAAQRLAPLQAATWGHPHTTGLPTIDCFFSAASLEPPDAEDHYTEKLVRLPRLGCCVTASRVDPEPIGLERLGIKTDAPLLLSPGTPYKYAPQHDWVFPAIAKRLGRCTIVFFKDPGAPWAYLNDRLVGRLSKAFAERGLRFSDHCVVLPWQERAAYYALMQRADLMLDTIGFSGFNTALQAMECGLPVVTRKGRFMRGRLAGGILQEVGLAELIAEDEAAYVNLAVELASDTGRRSTLRRRIEEKRGALFNDMATVHAFQDHLLDAAGR